MDRDVAMLETLGDTYSSGGDHRAAMNSYQGAFDICAEDMSAQMRLASKVGRSAFHRGVGSDADEWFNIPLEESVPTSTTAGGLVHFHLQQIRALWSISRTTDIVAMAERTLGTAITSKNAALILAMRLSLATVLHLLSRHDDAEHHLRAIDVRELPQDHKVLCMYHRARGIAYTSAGNGDEAFDSLATALYHAEQDRDAYATASILSAKGICANSLGRIELAAGSFSHALTIARENNFLWNAALISLEYARVLSRQGNHHLAHAHVVTVSTFENAPPILTEALAEIGIPIAIASGDGHLLERCANDDALTFAFRSGEPPRLGPVASSFAKYYFTSGRQREAKALLAKALSCVTKADQNYDLALASAEFGEKQLFSAAREILRTRTLLPNADVATAHLSYFDALVFRREGNVQACQREATTAAHHFRKLRWTSHEVAANSLCTTAASERKLTVREQTVARLAIAGLSNQDIAKSLSISERTVEAHMTSILRRTGLQSRHQLMGAISG